MIKIPNLKCRKQQAVFGAEKQVFQHKISKFSERSVTGFTLIEVAVTLIITIILLVISFSLLSFKKDFWILKEKSLFFVKNLSETKRFSLQGSVFSNKKICGAGLLISPEEYLGIAVSSDKKDCAKVDSNLFNLTNKANIESDNNIIKISKTFNFTTAQENLLKENLKNIDLSIYKNDDPNKIDFQKFEIIFRNPYAEPIIFVLPPIDANPEITNWDNIKFVLKFKNDNDSAKITITKIGQILFEQ